VFITEFYWIPRGNVLADYRVQFTAVNRKESIRQLVSIPPNQVVSMILPVLTSTKQQNFPSLGYLRQPSGLELPRKCISVKLLQYNFTTCFSTFL